MNQDVLFLIISVVGLLLIGGGLYIAFAPPAQPQTQAKTRAKPAGQQQQQPQPAEAAAAGGVPRGARRRRGAPAGARNRRLDDDGEGARGGGEQAVADAAPQRHERERERERPQGRQARQEERAEERDESEDEGDNENEEGEEDAPLTRKQMRKLEKKQAKEEERMMREAAIKEKQEKAKKREEEDDRRRAQREAEEQAQAELEARLKEEKEKKEQAEYDKWKDLFSVDEEGMKAAEDEDEAQNMLGRFIDYIKTHKVVILEDLAAHFRMRAQEAIDRVHDLEKSGHITGVVDDRGKFIYIEREEMEKVAKFINKRGRLSLADLAAESNKLISLNVVETPAHDAAAGGGAA